METKTTSGRCYECGQASSLCLCSFVRPFWTSIRFVILMHPMEAKRERVGTGRLSRRCLLNSEIRVGVDFTADERVNSLLNDDQFQSFILYPGPMAVNLSKLKSTQVSSLFQPQKQPLLFLLDGTWPCAKKMMKLSHNLHHVPRLSLDPQSPSRFIIKQQPEPSCLSTIESIYHVLKILRPSENAGDNEVLIAALDRLVQNQLDCARDPSRPSYRKGAFKEPEHRRKAIKWEKRHLFFQG